jgi:hypothetical protein
MSDLTLDKPYRRGDRGGKVKLIQEWLGLRGLHVGIDGDFGPATEAVVKQFCTQQGLPVSGVVDTSVFDRLIAPMKAALTPIPAQGKPLGELVVAYAQQHLQQRPREIGGQNRGPWVRMYMDGNEGTQWAWCAGFTCFCLQQACQSLGVSLPLVPSFSCDSLAASARDNSIFVREPQPSDRTNITPGSLFLVRRTKTDWIHTGIVVRAASEVFSTLEGNTNDDGSREGYEVCARTRGYGSKDFIRL